jgi:hypothetical protein
MSNNTNPKDLGVVGFFNEVSQLDANNTEDTIKFTVPSTQSLLSREGIVLDKVDIVGYAVRLDFFNLDEPVDLSLGTDSNSDGSFDQTNEILSQTTVEPDSSFQAFIVELPAPPDFSPSTDFSQENQTLFLDIESTNSNTNNYDLDSNLLPVFKGDLTGQDDSYCCDGSHNNKYYYDRLDELSLEGGTDVVAGDTIEVSLFSKSFDPVLFLLNRDTGAVIDVEYSSAPVTIGADTYQVVNMNFIVPSNTDNYVVSVESASANQQGEYFLQGAYY